MADKLAVRGHGNFTVAGDVILQDGEKVSIQAYFDNLDACIRSNIVSDGKIKRGNSYLDYSSGALFTSLIRVGIPLDAALLIPRDIIPILEDVVREKHPPSLDSSDIRYAVAECIGGLTFEGHSQEESSMWCAAYIKRYGNPDNDFIFVVDHSEEKILNFEYITEDIIPHLLRRILGLGRYQNALTLYPEIFSTTVIERMSREILSTINSLDLYSIRYKTLINLLEDIIIEPPHPWLVNIETAQNVLTYNFERMQFHFKQLHSDTRKNIGTLIQHAREYFMHSGAVILSMYGAFLGVGPKYGLYELHRMLKIRHKNPNLWSFCDIDDIEADFQRIHVDINSFCKAIKKINNKLYCQANEKMIGEIRAQACEFSHIVEKLRKNRNYNLSLPCDKT